MDPNQQSQQPINTQPPTQFEATMPASPNPGESLGGPVAPAPQKNIFPILLIAILVVGAIGIASYFLLAQNYTASQTPQYQVRKTPVLTITPTPSVSSAEDVDVDTRGLDSDLSSLNTDVAGL